MEYTKGKWSLTGRDANGAVSVFTDEENIATVGHEYDARLIAAAPMFYEALKKITTYDILGAINIAKKAIAKAEGK